MTEYPIIIGVTFVLIIILKYIERILKGGTSLQEGIIQIGNAILKDGNLLDNLVQEILPIVKNKQRYVLKMNFITDEKRLIIDAKEEMNEKTAYKYLYIGSASGSNSPQWYASSTTEAYHITETLPNLRKIDLGEKLNTKIKNIVDEYYVDLGEDIKSNKNRYILDLKKFNISDEDVTNIYDIVKKEEEEKYQKGIQDKKNTNKNIKKIIKNTYVELFNEYVKKELKVNPKQIGLYTLLIDSKPLSEEEEYRQAIIKENEKNNKKKKTSNKKNLIIEYCSVCGSSKNVTHKIKTKIKFYTTNLITFASELDKNNGYKKNMLMCQDCIEKIIVAEKYIINNLNTTLSGFSVYIIPHFIIGQPMSKEELDDCSHKINKSFNMVVNYDSIDQLKSEIDNALIANDRYDESYYLLNFIFYKNVNVGTKVQRLIKDVSPSIFAKIAEALYKVHKTSQELMGENYKRNITLGKLYSIVPVRKDEKGRAQQYKRLLQFYDNIFTGKRMYKKNLIESILDTIKIQYFEEESYNVSSGQIHNTIMDGNFYIKFLNYLGNIKEGIGMDYDLLNLDEHIKSYINEMKYSEEQTALFLLGYLVGEIGNSQRKRSSEGKKPILNKLNFGGIDKGKLIRLIGDVFNKLQQEKILKYNEIVFSECKRLIDKNLNDWNMNKHENLFYILSGYGYASTRPIYNKKSGGDNDEK